MKSYNGFPGSYRLLKTTDFQRLSDKGRAIRGIGFRVRFLANDYCHPRLGVTVSRRVSKKASVRNFIKRQVREKFRERKQHLPAVDIVFIANVSATTLSGKEIRKSMAGLFDKIHQKPGNKSYYNG